MTELKITENGIQIPTFDEFFEEAANEYREIYGNDINLSQESPDGQRVAIEAKRRHEIASFGVQLYNSLDPELATGLSLNRLLKLSGLFLQPESRSQVDVEIDMEFDKVIPSGYTVRDELGQNWITLDDNSLVAGVNIVTLFAEVFGEIEADTNTVNEPVTIELGVISVTNPAPAVPGKDEETPEEVRIRRNKSLENPATSNRGSMYARLANITNVSDLQVYENPTNTIVNGIPAHGIWVVIEGGDVETIAEIMAKNKHDGTAMRGAISEIYTEIVTRPNGSTFTIIHTMLFDRPTNVSLTVEVDAAKKNPTDIIDVNQIKKFIAAKEYEINKDALASELYSEGYKAGSNFILTDLTIDDGVTGPTEGRITNELDERFTIDELDITVNLI